MGTGRSVDRAAALKRPEHTMKQSLRNGLFVLVTATAAGCASIPNGPGVMALPGQGMSFEQFQGDDYACQAYARQATGLPPTQQAATDSAVNSAAVGTAVGAAAGALLGAAGGNAGTGAAIGAGTGLIFGSAAGTDAYGGTAYNIQNRFDDAYIQCMYAKGHQVPVPASIAQRQLQQQQAASYPVAPPVYAPPPPAYPPLNTPPPPGY